MMPAWLTVPPQALWPGRGEEHLAYAARMIERAEAIILGRFPDIGERLSRGEISLSVVAGVVEDMVTRALNSFARGGLVRLGYPDADMQWESGGGAGEGSVLFLTVDELLLLTPRAATGAFTVNPYLGRLRRASRSW